MLNMLHEFEVHFRSLGPIISLSLLRTSRSWHYDREQGNEHGGNCQGGR